MLIRSCTDTQIDPMLMDKLYDSGCFQITNTGKFAHVGTAYHTTNLQVCAGNSTGLFDEMDTPDIMRLNLMISCINARKLFGAAGMVVFIVIMTRFALPLPQTYPHYCWTGCLGWIYNELWVIGWLPEIKNSQKSCGLH